MAGGNPPDGYRPCAGAVVLDGAGLVFVARRIDVAPLDPHAWQLPQGGIDAGEAPEPAARRELAEETNIRSISLLAELPGWLSYDFPPEILGVRFKKYRGQTQKWFAYRFLGDLAEIDLNAGPKPEFSAWDWVPLERLPALAVPFKRDIYAAVAEGFGSLPDVLRSAC